ncbi:hypothetical protein QTP70_031877, partial [Hemibagrus guttatus]
MTSFLSICMVLGTMCVSLLSANQIPVSGHVGSTAVLPCKLQSVDTETQSIRWLIDTETVFERKGKDTYQGEGYEDCVDVPEEELRKGNCSLVLHNLKLNDAAVYTSYELVRRTKRSDRSKRAAIPKLILISSVELSVSDRHQLVKLGKFKSNSRTTSTGAPQGCVLSPLLFSLYTNDCTSTDPSIKLLKFADDTTVIGLIQDGDESAYRQEIEQLAAWCSRNNLELNTLKTVEMIVDFRRNTPALPPLTIMNSTVPTVASFRFLGTTISQDLKWDTHIDSTIKKAQQRLYFLRQLRKFNLPQELLIHFYSAVIESVLCTSLTVWFGSATKSDMRRLQRTVRTAERIIGAPLPTLQELYTSRDMAMTDLEPVKMFGFLKFPLPPPEQDIMTSFLSICMVLGTMCVSLLSADQVPVPGHVGSTAVLPCKLQSVDTETQSIRWLIDTETVFERKGKEAYRGEGYEDRVDVPEEELRKGNCSLVLNNLKLTDAAVYTSYELVKRTRTSDRSKRAAIPKLILISSVELSVS